MTNTSRTAIKSATLRLNALNDEIDAIKASDRSDFIKRAMIKSVDSARFMAWLDLRDLERKTA